MIPIDIRRFYSANHFVNATNNLFLDFCNIRYGCDNICYTVCVFKKFFIWVDVEKYMKKVLTIGPFFRVLDSSRFPVLVAVELEAKGRLTQHRELCNESSGCRNYAATSRAPAASYSNSSAAIND